MKGSERSLNPKYVFSTGDDPNVSLHRNKKLMQSTMVYYAATAGDSTAYVKYLSSILVNKLNSMLFTFLMNSKGRAEK